MGEARRLLDSLADLYQSVSVVERVSVMSAAGGAKRPIKEAMIPPGLAAIHKACSAIYSNQPNPRQASALVKYWCAWPNVHHL